MKILIAPLDWGLGHTTRCIPLIRYLLAQGHIVTAAAEGASATLLKENFPGIRILPLAGYGIRYSRSKSLFMARLLLQVPRILTAIKQEHRWLHRVQQHEQFDLVIADNRYGLYHSGLPCAILTHQLQIQSGRGALADRLLRRLHYRMLERFDACWVVDEAAGSGWSGKLAHPGVLPAHAAYIGLLSQFMSRPVPKVATQHILVLLSGPEPMRGQLEDLVLTQAGQLTSRAFVVVAGNPQGQRPAALPQHIRYYTHLAAPELLEQIAGASLVICRSGYSTVMDLAVLGKKALLVPTPGQTEQEYLAGYLQEKKYFNTVAQHDLQLAHDIPKALSAADVPLKPLDTFDTIAQVMQPFLQLIAQRSLL